MMLNVYLFRQYAELLRDVGQSGLSFSSLEMKDLEETLSLEERDLIDSQGDGSVKSFLSQNKTFIITQSDKLFLNLSEYLVQ